MTIQLAWFALFAVALYFIVSDESIAAAFYYVIGIATNFIRGRVWLMTNDPRNPVVKYIMWRRSMKMAKQLKRYFDEKNK